MAAAAAILALTCRNPINDEGFWNSSCGAAIRRLWGTAIHECWHTSVLFCCHFTQISSCRRSPARLSREPVAKHVQDNSTQHEAKYLTEAEHPVGAVCYGHTIRLTCLQIDIHSWPDSELRPNVHVLTFEADFIFSPRSVPAKARAGKGSDRLEYNDWLGRENPAFRLGLKVYSSRKVRALKYGVLYHMARMAIHKYFYRQFRW